MPAYLFTIRQNRADIKIISLISSKMADIMVYNAVECCNTMAAKTKALPNAELLFVIPVGEATAAVSSLISEKNIWGNKGINKGIYQTQKEAQARK